MAGTTTDFAMIKTEAIICGLPHNARVLDIGCFGFGLYHACARSGRTDIINHGVDYSRSDGMPSNYHFDEVDLNAAPLPFPNGHFDFVLAAHVIEHLKDGVSFFSECSRVAKPGGFVLITCPSERSLLRRGFPFGYEHFCSSSFFDDPTHLGRPYSPQSLYRLAKYHGMEPRECGYDESLLYKIFYPGLYLLGYVVRDAVFLEWVIWRAKGWAAYVLAQNPAAGGAPTFKYYVPERRSRLVSVARALRRLI